MIIIRDVLEFAAPLGDTPYCWRWVINFGLFSIRLHHWVGSDIHEHTHPYWMLIWCISGGYIDIHDSVCDKVYAPAIRFRKHTHRHRVITNNAWTLLITGPKIHKWWLYRDGKKFKPAEYFRKVNK